MRATPLRREDTKKRFETAVECAGYEVRDPLNERVGTEKKVSLNGAGEPEYVRVRMASPRQEAYPAAGAVGGG